MKKLTILLTIIICLALEFFGFRNFLVAENEKLTVNPLSPIDANKFVSGELLIRIKGQKSIKSLGSEVGIMNLDDLNKKFRLEKAKKVFKSEIPNSKFQVDNNQEMIISNVYKLTFSEKIDVLKAVQEYSRDPNIEWAEPNYIRKIVVTPNDTNWSLQWGLPKIQAPNGWDITTGTAQTVIAIVDTGVDWNHPDLANSIWINSADLIDGLDNDGNGFIDDYRGYDFVSVPASAVWPGEDPGPWDNDPMDFHGHGTHVSGIAAAQTNNSLGIAGTCWNCKIMAVRAGYKGTDGGGYLEDADCAAAIQYAAANGADIINMSWGDSVPSSIIETALNHAYSQGVFLVAAAGNQNSADVFYPAAYSNVIAVAATGQSDQKASFSNYGSWIDVSAPGTNIYSTYFDNTYIFMNGTSMASPFVAGLAGLLKFFRPTWTHDQIRAKILEKADNIGYHLNPGDLGTGRINVYQTFDPPSCSINSPTVNTWYEGMLTISATALDNSSVAQVAFEHSTDSTNGQDGIWFNVSGSPDFISPFALAWQSEPQTGVDPSVWLRCQAKDDENIYSFYSTQEIKIDNQPPINATPSEFSHSINAWSNDNTIEVIWSGADDGSGSGVAGYSYQWTTEMATSPDEILDTTELSLTSPALVDSDKWYFHLRTVDSVGNWTTETAHLGSFWINAQPPSKPATPSVSAGNNQVNLTWSPNPETDLAFYKIYRAVNQVGPYDFLAIPNPVTATAFSDTTAANGTTYYYRIKAVDNLNNESEFSEASNPAFPQAPSGGGGGYIFLDITPPTNTSILINGEDKETSFVNVMLILKAIGADWMMISNDSNFTGAIWEAYAESKPWPLISGAGVKTVYAKFKDSVGNVSVAVSDTIILKIDKKIKDSPGQKRSPAAPAARQRNLAKEQEFVRKWQGVGGRLPTAKQIRVGVYEIGRSLAAEIAFVKKWKGRGGRLPIWNEIIAGVY